MHLAGFTVEVRYLLFAFTSRAFCSELEVHNTLSLRVQNNARNVLSLLRNVSLLRRIFWPYLSRWSTCCYFPVINSLSVNLLPYQPHTTLFNRLTFAEQRLWFTQSHVFNHADSYIIFTFHQLPPHAAQAQYALSRLLRYVCTRRTYESFRRKHLWSGKSVGLWWYILFLTL